MKRMWKEMDEVKAENERLRQQLEVAQKLDPHAQCRTLELELRK
jgi:cell shape-determining protein MreC